MLRKKLVHKQDIEAEDEKTAKKLVNAVARELGFMPVHFVAKEIPMMVRQITPEQIVDLLNGMLKMDPQATQALIETRVPCNEEMAAHPTVQVLLQAHGGASVGLLGVLNGIIGVDKKDQGYLQAICDDAGLLIGFDLKAGK